MGDTLINAIFYLGCVISISARDTWSDAAGERPWAPPAIFESILETAPSSAVGPAYPLPGSPPSTSSTRGNFSLGDDQFASRSDELNGGGYTARGSGRRRVLAEPLLRTYGLGQHARLSRRSRSVTPRRDPSSFSEALPAASESSAASNNRPPDSSDGSAPVTAQVTPHPSFNRNMRGDALTKLQMQQKYAREMQRRASMSAPEPRRQGAFKGSSPVPARRKPVTPGSAVAEPPVEDSGNATGAPRLEGGSTDGAAMAMRGAGSSASVLASPQKLLRARSATARERGPASTLHGAPQPASHRAPKVNNTSRACPAGSRLLHYMETPKERGKPVSCSKSQYREWKEMAIMVHGVTNVDKMVGHLGTVNAKSYEVLVYEPAPSRHRKWVKAPLGANYFLVWGAYDSGFTRPVNRLVRMANADVILLVRGSEETLFTAKALARAKHLFRTLPDLGLVSMTAGWSKGRWHGAGGIPLEPAQGMKDFMFVQGVKQGPLIIRRSAFIAAGMLGVAGCPYDCEDTALFELSTRIPERTTATRRAVGLLNTGLDTTGLKQPICATGAGAPYAASGLSDQPVPGLVERAQHSGQTSGHASLTSHPSRRRLMDTSRAGNEARMSSPASASVGKTAGKAQSMIQGCGPSGWSSSPLPHGIFCSGQRVVDRPLVTLAIQYYKRSGNIKRIMHSFRNAGGRSESSGSAVTVEILVNNDSQSDHDTWMKELTGPSDHLVDMGNLHEIRGYNRLAKFANGDFIVFLQDDDVSKEDKWLHHALELFSSYPKMALLGGYRGRIDIGSKMHGGQVDGLKFGPGMGVRTCCKHFTHKCPKTNRPFMFVYKVNMGPMIVRRSVFLRLGMYSTDFSCPGAAGIGFDFEFSVRSWYHGFQVGLYLSKFKFDIGDHKHSGTRSSRTAYQVLKCPSVSCGLKAANEPSGGLDTLFDPCDEVGSLGM
ncbi:hypothetical protein CYMTET_47805 [Cymbomonas tetramitiformis]|uniref:Glycosyltransferase 2-like domain-containing protein n=1 Tax=Cymbomonas tetramitiformis TaxID=36881 RepID=A0AAE0BVG3_9CHLO|nr:hypothetical protein CYMTET_47805 [Cymbomonas tetramitiformis]